jgi:membrane protease YdiL (CAAX protease family)
MEEHLLKKRAYIYLAILYGFLFIGWSLNILLPEPYEQYAYTSLWGLFSVFPILATFLARKITNDRSPWFLRPNFRNNWKTYLIAAFLPGVAIFFGALIFFAIFPQDLDLTARNLVEQYSQFGAPETLLLTPTSIILIGIAFIFISPLIIPVHIFAFGEEIGWRGYFLPILLRLMNQRKAVILHAFLWGLAHSPLIYLGFNYGSDYWGTPITGIIMMTLVCIALGTWLGFLTIKSGSIIPATIFHGAGNVIGE